MQIELYQKLNNPIDAIQQLGKMFAKSGMFGCEKEEQGQVLAMVCMVEGKSPVFITTNYDIVEGKLRKKALAALADFRSGGGKHKWLSSGDAVTVKDEDRYAEIELTDKEGSVIKYRYSMADAKAEGLVKDRSRWVKRPGNMLRARCISNGLGMLCPEIFAGEDDEPVSESDTKPLLPKKEAATVESQAATAAPAKPEQASNVINVEATVVPQASAPDEKKTEEKPFTIDMVAVDTATGRLNAASEAALIKLFGEHVDAAFTWLKAKNWINEKISDINVDRAKRILSKPAEFMGFITKGAQ
jgi:hypothetical protein